MRSCATFLTVLLMLTLASVPAVGIGEAALIEVEGKVTLSGNAPFVTAVLVVDGGRLVIAGPLTDELRRLQNVSLRLVGWRKGTPNSTLGPVIDALGYAPVNDGYGKSPRVLVGLLLKQEGAWLLVDPGSARLYHLIGKLPAGLESANGAKVALTGRAGRGVVTPRGFAVEGFAVLAPAGKYFLGESK